MVRWSGAGRICWTSNPAGIRGKRCLGKDDFRRGAMFLLCAHPAPERRPRGTQTAGEPEMCAKEAVEMHQEEIALIKQYHPNVLELKPRVHTSKRAWKTGLSTKVSSW